jgi:hypothetical protein
MLRERRISVRTVYSPRGFDTKYLREVGNCRRMPLVKGRARRALAELRDAAWSRMQEKILGVLSIPGWAGRLDLGC